MLRASARPRGAAAGDLDAVVRAADPDRWLASRFIADRRRRAAVIALYAFDHELERVRHVASNGLLAEIRLTWWREVLDEIYGGGAVRAHPVARALGDVVAGRHLPREPLEAMIDARIAVLDKPGLSIDEARAMGRRRRRLGCSSGRPRARSVDPAAGRGAGRPGVGPAAVAARRSR